MNQVNSDYKYLCNFGRSMSFGECNTDSVKNLYEKLQKISKILFTKWTFYRYIKPIIKTINACFVIATN